MALFDACVDLNPYQIDAASFALRNPLSKGVLLADEVGLGKTIEARLVLCQYWAERKRRLLIICPASLRKLTLPSTGSRHGWRSRSSPGWTTPEERERLEKWAEDLVVAAEKELADTKSQIKSIRRHSRLATTLDEQNDLLEKQRKQRQQIFEVEDEIAEKRDALITGLQKRMSQKTKVESLFTIRWSVV